MTDDPHDPDEMLFRELLDDCRGIEQQIRRLERELSVLRTRIASRLHPRKAGPRTIQFVGWDGRVTEVKMKGPYQRDGGQGASNARRKGKGGTE